MESVRLRFHSKTIKLEAWRGLQSGKNNFFLLEHFPNTICFHLLGLLFGSFFFFLQFIRLFYVLYYYVWHSDQNMETCLLNKSIHGLSRQTDDKFWIKWMCVFFFLLKTITNMSNNAIKVVNKGCTNEELERKKQRKLCWPYCQEPACLNEVGCKGTHDHRMKT